MKTALSSQTGKSGERILRFLVVDDHAVVRRGVRGILIESFENAEVDEAATAAEALEQVCGQDFDAVILDVTMPGAGGLEALKSIKLTHPNLPVLMLSIHPEDQYAVRVLKAGAAGYMTKDSVPEQLVNAVTRILDGGRYVSSVVAKQLMTYVAKGNGERPHDVLSDREFQVLIMITSGKPVSRIANELSLSVKTISTYRARLLDKLGLETTAELMKYGLAHELLKY
ncbi:MAG: response regulator transcription factor [Kiritimatiellia bacterium]|nr:response regulator transcription factor [Kiritimatiellia bacterium]